MRKLAKLNRRLNGKYRNHPALILIALLVLVIAIRLAELLSIGPIYHFDSNGYTHFANLILNETEWRHSANLMAAPAAAPRTNEDGSSATDITTVRLIGYPALIAAFKLLFPVRFDYAVCLFQVIVATTAYSLLFLAGRSINVPTGITLLAVGLYTVSYSWLYDISLLSDSLYSNILIIILCILTRVMARGRRLSYGTAALLSLLAFPVVLLRGNGYVLVYTVAALIVIREAVHTKQVRRAIVIGVMFLGPSVFALELYKSWNEYRSGERFTSIIGSRALRTLVALELTGTSVLPRESPYYRAYLNALGRATYIGVCNPTKPPDFTDILYNIDHHSLAHSCAELIHAELTDKYRLNGPQIARFAMRQLMRTGLKQPFDLVRYMTVEMLPGTPLSFVTLDQVLAALTDFNFSDQISLKRHLAILSREPLKTESIIALVSEGVARFLSGILFLTFCLAIPTMLAMEVYLKRGFRPIHWIFTIHFLVFAVLLAGFSAIHIEPRYILVVQAFVLLDGLFILSCAYNRFCRRAAER